MKKWTDSPLRDPVRFVLMQELGAKGRLALLAAMTAVCFAAVMVLMAAMQGVVVVALTGAACAAVLMGFIFHAFGRDAQSGRVSVIVLLCMGALSVLAVGAHISLLDIAPGRYANVLDPMLYDMWNYDLLSAMAWEEGSWSGLYLIVCALFSRLETFPALYAFKLFDLVCQCLAAGAVLRLARLRGASVYGAVAGAFACVLTPTMLMNAGVWAQCDATFAMFTLWGLALLLEDHPLAGCVLWGLALSAKLQSAFLFPLLIVMFMDRKVALRHILALMAAALVCHAAILIDGQGLTGVITRYAGQLEEARWGEVGLADHAPGVYSLMVVASVREFSGMGLYLGIVA
ncbi:MAG: hypothetical protein Q4A66_11695, partial [Eubacteriales bacterium]|nr:hypothetical protein [Eubacteriales bacterium]